MVLKENVYLNWLIEKYKRVLWLFRGWESSFSLGDVFMELIFDVVGRVVIFFTVFFILCLGKII